MRSHLPDEGGRGNICFPVEEGFGKPWVSEVSVVVAPNVKQPQLKRGDILMYIYDRS